MDQLPNNNLKRKVSQSPSSSPLSPTLYNEKTQIKSFKLDNGTSGFDYDTDNEEYTEVKESEEKNKNNITSDVNEDYVPSDPIIITEIYRFRDIKISATCKDLIDNLMHIDKSKRFTASQSLHHYYLFDRYIQYINYDE